jgi:hypothetical protein
VGQEKAVIAEEITLTFGVVDAANAPVPINGVGVTHSEPISAAPEVAAVAPPIRAAMNG